jgi:hypothetical protein
MPLPSALARFWATTLLVSVGLLSQIHSPPPSPAELPAMTLLLSTGLLCQR